jgi:hypothetical protein
MVLKTKKLLVFVITLLTLGIYFSDKIELGRDYEGNRYIRIHFKNSKPYTTVSCWLDLPAPEAKRCYKELVMENATEMRGPTIPPGHHHSGKANFH